MKVIAKRINTFYFILSNIGQVITGIATVIYIIAIINKPAIEIYQIGIVAFGILAALTGLCYSMASVIEKEDKSVVILAAEKFFLACILLLMTIFLKFIQQDLSTYKFITDSYLVSQIIKYLFIILTSANIGTAGGFTTYGFQYIHDLLWKRENNNMKA